MRRTNATLSFLSGAAFGAGLMYVMDPDRGNRRRALIRDKMFRAGHEFADAADKGIRDLQHRAQGTVAEAWAALRNEPVPDEVLVERVRAKLGRLSSHPDSISADSHQGRIVLSGPILQAELDTVLSGVWSVRGVRGVENRLEAHKQAGNIPGLQGGAGARRGQQFELLQENWAPGTRMVAGMAGALTLAGAPRRGIFALPVALAGTAMILRAVGNMPFRSLLGLGGRRAIQLQKTIEVHAPVEEVFKLWSNPENFPKFMAHVQEVRKSGESRYHWVARGPAGTSVSWDSEVTQIVPNELLAWRSVPGSIAGNAGIIRFQPTEHGTRIDLRMSYNPPGGALGHLFAMIFGADPKAALDDDLARMKSLFEVGKTRAHGERVSKEKLGA